MDAAVSVVFLLTNVSHKQFAEQGKQNMFNSKNQTIKANSGFTMIELLVVLVLMVIISVASLPSFTTIGRGSSVNGVLSNVAATLSLTRQRAISHKEEMIFIYGKSDEGSYYKVENPDGLLIQSTNLLPLGVEFDVSGEEEIRFKTDGTLVMDTIEDAVEDIYVQEDNDKKANKSKGHIQIYGLTGMVKVFNDSDD